MAFRRKIPVWFEITTLERNFENILESVSGRSATMGKDGPPISEEGLKVSVAEVEEGLPQKPKPRKFLLIRVTKFLRRTFSRQKDSPSPWYKLVRNALYLFTAAIVLAVIAVVFVTPSLPNLPPLLTL